MSMSFGGDPYAGLAAALMQRRQQRDQRQQPQQQMQPMGGTMQLQPARFDSGGGGGQSGLSGALGAMPSASSMAQLLQRMQGDGNGPSMWERFQGWGSDLGSRLPSQPSGPIQTYQPGQTPIGGGY